MLSLFGIKTHVCFGSCSARYQDVSIVCLRLRNPKFPRFVIFFGLNLPCLRGICFLIGQPHGHVSLDVFLTLPDLNSWEIRWCLWRNKRKNEPCWLSYLVVFETYRAMSHITQIDQLIAGSWASPHISTLACKQRALGPISLTEAIGGIGWSPMSCLTNPDCPDSHITYHTYIWHTHILCRYNVYSVYIEYYIVYIYNVIYNIEYDIMWCIYI